MLELIAGKWTMLVLVALEDGRPMRFGELRRRLDGVTPKVLTGTLRALEREGLLTRILYPTVPPCVEYRLAGLGQEVGGLVQSITDWSQANIAALQAAREEFDERAARQAPGAADNMPFVQVSRARGRGVGSAVVPGRRTARGEQERDVVGPVGDMPGRGGEPVGDTGQ
ncbi:helix-turn-helix domain-containing protein [Streptomyces sp. NPDC050704]|uniref:winged helix-turn-helix transcriptional regulator n=1 Tax=Streptomyces sp. NPDC050704 TaxID=3157219 RepID=UPI00344AED60